MAEAKKSGVHLRVLYDYDYQGHDGQPVKIKTGEEYLLLKKTTPEWWYVIKPSKDGTKKPIYVPANYMEEFHKTIIQVDNTGPAKKQGPRTAPKPTRQAPTPQPRTTTAVKKKGPPPKPPAKPVVRKASDEEEVLKQLDNILEHAFDEFDTVDEEDSSSGTNSKSSSLQRGAELHDTESPVSTGQNSRTGSLQRGENLQDTESITIDNSKQLDSGNSNMSQKVSHSKGDDPSTPDEPEPDYENDNDSNSSPNAGRHGTKDNTSPNKELMGDSGISEGSMECLDKVNDSAENSLERNRKADELPNYENIGSIQRISQNQEDQEDDDEMPDYANIADIQAHIHVDPPPAKPPADTKPIEVTDGWEMYKEPVTQRFFFFNPSTNVSTWIRPKLKHSETENRDSVFTHSHRLKELKTNSFGTPVILDDGHYTESRSEKTVSCFLPVLSQDGVGEEVNGESTNQVEDEAISLPEGWKKEKDDKGQLLYINDENTQTWRRSTDTSGKRYFYNEQTGDAKWELPQLHMLKKQPPNTPIQLSRPGKIAIRHHGLLKQKQRASWAPGDVYVPNLTGSLKAAGMPVIKMAIPGMASPPSRTSKEVEIDEEARDKLLENIERSTSPSAFNNPKKFMRQSSSSSSPGDLESRYREISSPLPALQRLYSEHYFDKLNEKMSAPDLYECSTLLREKSSKGKLGTFQMELNEKQGMIKVKKVLENGKKSKKNWCQNYVFIKSGTVFIYKDQKSANPKPSAPNGKPESQYELHGAQVELGKKDVSSKKIVIQLTTSSDSQSLFQLDDSDKLNEWFAVMRDNIDQIEKPLGSSFPELRNLSGNTTDKKLIDESMPTLSSNKGKKSSSRNGTLERESTSTDETEKSSNIRQFLFKWFNTSRPTVESLRKKGIYKDAVFGSHLHRICDKDECNIPHFVSKSINAIERRGLGADGIYRISGNMAQIQKLRISVDSGSQYDLDSPEWEIHVLTGALKMLFRELTEPLIPFSFYNKFTAATQVKDSKKKVFRDLIKILPPSNRETLKVLSFHLLNVTEKSSQNRMQVQNLAIVWGPTLMRPPDSAGNEMALSMVQSGQCIEYILQNCQVLF